MISIEEVIWTQWWKNLRSSRRSGGVQTGEGSGQSSAKFLLSSRFEKGFGRPGCATFITCDVDGRVGSEAALVVLFWAGSIMGSNNRRFDESLGIKLQ